MYDTKHYNLKAIIAVGYKVDSQKAETEFEKYRIIQDRLYTSDFDKYLLELESELKTE